MLLIEHMVKHTELSTIQPAIVCHRVNPSPLPPSCVTSIKNPPSTDKKKSHLSIHLFVVCVEELIVLILHEKIVQLSECTSLAAKSLNG